MESEKRVHFANPAVVEESDESERDEAVPPVTVTDDEEMSSGTHSTYRDALLKSPCVSTPVSEKILPTKLEKGTISGKERRLLTQKRAEAKGNRLAGTTMDVNEAHRLFGHKSGATLQKIATALGINLTGKFKPCSSCMLVTARRSKVNRVSMVKSKVPGERLCVDTTGPFPPALAREQYVVVVVDEATGYSWRRFSTNKREVAELVIIAP